MLVHNLLSKAFLILFSFVESNDPTQNLSKLPTDFNSLISSSADLSDFGSILKFIFGHDETVSKKVGIL